MKRILVILLTLALIVVLPGCSKESSKYEPIDGSVKLTDANGKVILDTDLTLQLKSPTAKDAVIKACKENGISYTFKNGMFDNFNGIASTKDAGWILYVDDKVSEVGASDAKLDYWFRVEFKYQNYSETLKY
ncbi:MAG: DUF4430 domain-containing protein [Bacillota bacterium]|nr:DUF4430 domain-containing protein [Bacillota bacterium]